MAEDTDATAREGVATEAHVPAAEAEPETAAATGEGDAETHEGDQPEGGEGEQTAAEEEIEFDFGGNKFRAKKSAIPEDVASELDKFSKGIWSDYSRKNGDIAERAKSLEAREKAVGVLHALNDEALNTYSRGLAVRQEIEQLGKVDLNALWQSDPDQARRVSDAISSRQAEFQNIVARVSQLEGASDQTQQAELARRMTEGRTVMEKRVPNFTAKHAAEVVEYVATNYGIPKEVAARDWPLNPATAHMAYKAMLYDRLQADAKRAAQGRTPGNVAATVPLGGKGGVARKGPKDMSVADMAKHLGLPG